MWSELPIVWQACIEQAWEAYCAGCVPIGAVITGAEGEILVRARNRIGERHAPHRQICDSTLAHAELNAVLQLPRSVPLRHQYTLYTTMEPCPLCLGAVYMSGLRSFSYACRDPYAGSADLLGTTPYLSIKPITVAGPWDACLEDILTAVQVEDMIRYLEDRPDRLQAVLDSWSAVLPRGVALGEQLHRSGRLQKMKRSHCIPAAVIDELAGLLS